MKFDKEQMSPEKVNNAKLVSTAQHLFGSVTLLRNQRLGVLAKISNFVKLHCNQGLRNGKMLRNKIPRLRTFKLRELSTTQ